MKKFHLLSTIMVVAVSISSCSSSNYSPNEQAGVVIGGLLGGVAGKQVGKGSGRTAAIIVGTLIGSQIGGAIGQSMDETDRLKTSHALENVRTGVTTTWRNPDTNYNYSVTPTRTYESQTGQCREYTIDAIIGDKKEKIYGKACRQPDGSWKVVS